MTVLGWTALALLALGGVTAIYGEIDFDRQHGDGKMGGAILMALGVALLAAGVVLGVIWLALE